MRRNIYLNLNLMVIEISNHQDQLAGRSAQECKLPGGIKCHVLVICRHQIVKKPVTQGGFAVTQSKEICIEPLQFPFLIGQQGSVPSPVVVPAPDGVDRPVVEDGGTAIPSAETLFVH